MEQPLIGVVGPCGAGKSTLVSGLRALGYHVKHIAQEHSYAPWMWRKIANPDLLIFLDVSYPVTIVRCRLDWTESEYQAQVARLNIARLYADFYIQTDRLTIREVRDAALQFLHDQSIDC